MGEISSTMNYYFSDSRRFADLFNAAFFHGRTVVEAEELSEASEVYHQPKTWKTGAAKTEAGKQARRGESIHDVCKKLKSGSVLRILALENQDLTDYSMPFRCMQYDTMEYGKQVDELRRKNEREGNLTTDHEKLCGIRRQDRLVSVYTLCLYHGEEKWDGPRSLADMMEFAKGEVCFRELFNDYPLRLYCVNEAEDLDMFHTEVTQLFRALQYRGDRVGLRRLLENSREYQHLDRDTLEAMSVLLKFPSVWKKRNKFMNMNGEKEEFNMCLAVREWEAEAKRIGRKEGLEEGLKKGLKEGLKEGGLSMLFQLVKEGLLSSADAAGKAGLSETDFLEKMDTVGK